MKMYRVTVPDDWQFYRRHLWRVGKFERGDEPREMMLAEGQVSSMRNKGLTVEPLTVVEGALDDLLEDIDLPAIKELDERARDDSENTKGE